MLGAGLMRNGLSKTLANEAALSRGAKKPRRQGHPWTPEELELLKALPVAEVARLTGRTEMAVMVKRVKLGIKPKKRGKGK